MPFAARLNGATVLPSPDSPVVAESERAVLRRDGLLAGGAMLAALGAVAAGVLALVPDYEMAAGAVAGGAVGVLLAGVSVPWLWGATGGVRMAITLWIVLGGLLAGGAALDGPVTLVVAGVTVMGAAALFLAERGTQLDLSIAGATLRRTFPLASERRLAWADVRTLRADLRVIQTQGAFGTHVAQQQRVVLTGDGVRLDIDSTRWRGATEWTGVVINVAGPAALRWMQAELASGAELRLGPLTFSRTEVAWRRGSGRRSPEPFVSGFAHVVLTLMSAGQWLLLLGLLRGVNALLGPERARLADITVAEFAAGKLRLAGPAGDRYFRLAAIPNGLFVPDLLRALQVGGAA